MPLSKLQQYWPEICSTLQTCAMRPQAPSVTGCYKVMFDHDATFALFKCMLVFTRSSAVADKLPDTCARCQELPTGEKP